MYQTGSGVPQDLVAAYKWYSIAASLMSNSTELGRNYPGRNRDRIAAHLAPTQLARAQRWRGNGGPRGKRRAGRGPGSAIPTYPAAPRGANGSQIYSASLPSSATIPARRTALWVRARAAIRAFQTTIGLPVDGRVSNGLLVALIVAIRATRAAKSASASARAAGCGWSRPGPASG